MYTRCMPSDAPVGPEEIAFKRMLSGPNTRDDATVEPTAVRDQVLPHAPPSRRALSGPSGH